MSGIKSLQEEISQHLFNGMTKSVTRGLNEKFSNSIAGGAEKAHKKENSPQNHQSVPHMKMAFPDNFQLDRQLNQQMAKTDIVKNAAPNRRKTVLLNGVGILDNCSMCHLEFDESDASILEGEDEPSAGTSKSKAAEISYDFFKEEENSTLNKRVEQMSRQQEASKLMPSDLAFGSSHLRASVNHQFQIKLEDKKGQEINTNQFEPKINQRKANTLLYQQVEAQKIESSTNQYPPQKFVNPIGGDSNISGKDQFALAQHYGCLEIVPEQSQPSLLSYAPLNNQGNGVVILGPSTNQIAIGLGKSQFQLKSSESALKEQQQLGLYQKTSDFGVGLLDQARDFNLEKRDANVYKGNINNAIDDLSKELNPEFWAQNSTNQQSKHCPMIGQKEGVYAQGQNLIRYVSESSKYTNLKEEPNQDGEFDGMIEASQLRGVCHEIKFTELKLSGLSQLTYAQALRQSVMDRGKMGLSLKEANPKFEALETQHQAVPDEDEEQRLSDTELQDDQGPSLMRLGRAGPVFKIDSVKTASFMNSVGVSVQQQQTNEGRE
ncbi:hypothetical protein FGO68_gene17436 [Halteria grandinella]|uniref:Uncharacterized protein n=1 Tax=Halteria grandinella TaxID=5974 RepID=A0A8J8P265_HALGN|nr:hypothetical protein FGO68_gene17436 [Halteria grandinella]